ncbi:MAG: hypothetical protein FWD73_00635 [Polyangiaceae bacterium]|nr:hypothetical protein [Polyangiaceae bacterium]
MSTNDKPKTVTKHGPMIPTPKLGQGLEVSAIGFGCMGLNFGLGVGVDKATAIALIRGTTKSH